MWSGAIADIPTGWHLCDGNAGRPDLRDRFIIGAGDTYNPDATGGSAQHGHTFTGDGHEHWIPPGDDIQAGTDFLLFTSWDPVTGTTYNTTARPPLYALAYIIFPKEQV